MNSSEMASSSSSTLNVVALISGGKDSIYSIYKCFQFGHSVQVLANLYPNNINEQRDSFMYQTQGYELLPSIAQCIGLPLEKRGIKGKSLHQELRYDSPKEDDEVEDLYELLLDVKRKYPGINAVCSGAVLSTYQRNRVENVCQRLNLTSLAFLWNRDQKELLDEMIQNNFEAVLVKVCSMGLDAYHLGKTIADCRDYFLKLDKDFGFHVCGEGGEYESIVLDCPLYTKGKLVLDAARSVTLENRAFSPICVLEIDRFHVEPNVTHLTFSKSHITTAASPAVETAIRTSLVGANQEKCLIQYPDHSLCEWFVGPVFGKTFEEGFDAFLTRMNDDLSKICYVHLYLRDLSDFGKANAAFEKLFTSTVPVPQPPSRATIELGWMGDQVIAITALICSSTRSVLHVRSRSEWAPMCIGPYSQCNVMDGSVALIAGQIPLQPATMALLTNDSFIKQLQLCIQNCNRIRTDSYVKGTRNLGAIIYVNTGRSHTNPKLALLQTEQALISLANLDNDQSTVEFIQLNMVLVAVPRLPREAPMEIELVSATSNADITEVSADIVTLDTSDTAATSKKGRMWSRWFFRVDDNIGSIDLTNSDIAIPAQEVAKWNGKDLKMTASKAVRYSLTA
jgi:diphthine-ammonia ligase